jgi:hypothetical protein
VIQAEPCAPLPRHFLARTLNVMGVGAAALRAIDGVTEPGPGSYSNVGRAYALLGCAKVNDLAPGCTFVRLRVCA